ncbi:VanZ family protein [Actinokineospora pegani]|uniref:VanZ family protein n=1 Tax=Actinokineospora pegani TaxID=2654637 RepID=UPI0012EAF30F|nr:VanZ family protein [Actinokineospora pegani]
MTALTRVFLNVNTVAAGAVLAGLLVAGLVRSRAHGADRVARTLGAAALGLWLLLLVYVTIVLSPPTLGVRFSLIPLADTVDGLFSRNWDNVAAATAANVALFLPLGAGLAIRAPRASWVVPAAAGAGLSLAVELTQGFLVRHGAVAADDLITNTAGAVLGWALLRWWGGHRALTPAHHEPGRAEPESSGPPRAQTGGTIPGN